VAYALHMPIYKLKAEMPYDELLNWIAFFNRRPVGWREDQRTYLLMRAQGMKEKAENIFPTLKLLAAGSEKQQKPDRAVPKGKMLELMLAAKNGDDSNWKPSFGVNNNES